MVAKRLGGFSNDDSVYELEKVINSGVEVAVFLISVCASNGGAL